MIRDVSVAELVANIDDRGLLTEILRCIDPHFTKFGQVYMVVDPVRNTIRAFHKHEITWDWFCIIHGSAKFILIDDRPESKSYKEQMIIVASPVKPRLITVPPGVLHGWMSLEDETILISIASEVYNREKPDEIRIPPDAFGDIWTVKGR